MQKIIVVMVFVFGSFNALCASTVEERVKADYELFIKALEKKTAEIKAVDGKADNALVDAGVAKQAAAEAIRREAALRAEFEAYKAAQAARPAPVVTTAATVLPAPVVQVEATKGTPGAIRNTSATERHYADGSGNWQPFAAGIMGVTDTGAYHELQVLETGKHRWEYVDGQRGVQGARLNIVRIVSPDEAKAAIERGRAANKPTSYAPKSNVHLTAWRPASLPAEAPEVQHASLPEVPVSLPVAHHGQYHVCVHCQRNFPFGQAVGHVFCSEACAAHVGEHPTVCDEVQTFAQPEVCHQQQVQQHRCNTCVQPRQQVHAPAYNPMPQRRIVPPQQYPVKPPCQQCIPQQVRHVTQPTRYSGYTSAPIYRQPTNRPQVVRAPTPSYRAPIVRVPARPPVVRVPTVRPSYGYGNGNRSTRF